MFDKNWWEIFLPKEHSIELPTCKHCENVLTHLTQDNFNVCEKCGEYLYLPVLERIEMLSDVNSFAEYNSEMTPQDVLKFEDTKKYKDRLKSYIKKTGRNSGVVTGKCSIMGQDTQLCVMDFEFMGGSLGTIEGEKISLAIEKAIEEKTGVVIVSASGGARMQESTYSLMQMSKVSACLKKLSSHNLPYISVLTNPTMGGVSASYAFLGDVIVSEPKAVIGFAGRRVIEQTIKQELPEDFQTAEFLLSHGLIDSIVPRVELKSFIGKYLEMFNNNTCNVKEGEIE